MIDARDPALEAKQILGDGSGARVLEPSPPAITDDEFFADDPTRTVSDASIVVGPTLGDRTWLDVVAERPDLQTWAAQRWLVPATLQAVPATLAEQRVGLHRLATYVIAPARHQANGKFGLRWTKGGFGTPFYGNDQQVRVEGTQLVVQEAGAVRSSAISSLQAAADFIGSAVDPEVAAEHDSPALGDLNAPLEIDAAVVEFLANWWGLGTAALEQVRADEESVDPSRVQLWPGHFDPAIEVGDEHRRASYGASPGDHTSAEPYLYVSVWWPDRLAVDAEEEFWNADGFIGARLTYAELLAADNPLELAVSFFRTGRDRLVQAAENGQEHDS